MARFELIYEELYQLELEEGWKDKAKVVAAGAAIIAMMVANGISYDRTIDAANDTVEYAQKISDTHPDEAKRLTQLATNLKKQNKAAFVNTFVGEKGKTAAHDSNVTMYKKEIKKIIQKVDADLASKTAKDF